MTRHRFNRSQLLATLVALALVILSLVLLRAECFGQQPIISTGSPPPQQPPPLQQSQPFGHSILPHYPGFPIRNWIRVNVWGVPPLYVYQQPPAQFVPQTQEVRP